MLAGATTVENLALLNASSRPDALAGGGTASFSAALDSGCTASATDDSRRITNLRSCNEVFGDANGRIVQCTGIGDMPVYAISANGQRVNFSLTNVRVVPSFKHTLLSVNQLWAEQRIDTQFADHQRIIFPASSGGASIPFTTGVKLPTISLVSGPLTSVSGSSATARNMDAARQSCLLGFHQIKSTAHIAKPSAAQAGELSHRRTHPRPAPARALTHNTKDDPSYPSPSPRAS